MSMLPKKYIPFEFSDLNIVLIPHLPYEHFILYLSEHCKRNVQIVRWPLQIAVIVSQNPWILHELRWYVAVIL
jgi:hypothetical protein